MAGYGRRMSTLSISCTWAVSIPFSPLFVQHGRYARARRCHGGESEDQDQDQMGIKSGY